MSEPFLVHPKRLIEIAENSMLFTEDRPATLAVNDSIMLGFDGEKLFGIGRGRYSCSLHRVAPIKEPAGMEPWDVIVDLDSAADAVTALKGVDGLGRRDTTVEVMPIEGGLVVSDGAEAIVTLIEDEHSASLRGDEEFEGIYEVAFRAMEMEPRPLDNVALTWTKGVINKLNKVKLGSPLHDSDRWSSQYLGGSTFRYLMIDNETDFTAHLEACRDGFEE